MMISNDEYWMKLALEQAKLAKIEDEIPIGSVLVKNEELILADHNRTRQLHDPLAHAEKLIIDKILSSKIKFLSEFKLFVTIEPCLMCAGMMIWARIGVLVFGAYDLKSGAVGSVYNILQDSRFNHQPSVVSGCLANEAEELIKQFFREKRKANV